MAIIKVDYGTIGGGITSNILMLCTISANGLSKNDFYNEELLTYVSGTISNVNGKFDATFTSNVKGTIDVFMDNADNAGGTSVYINDTIVCNVSASPYYRTETNIPINIGDTVRIQSTAYYADIVIKYNE